jgi:Fe2+ or Zn2+ uptake regulation protein
MYDQLLIEKGLRPTPHRIRIAQKVFKKHSHFTAEEVCDWAIGLKQKLSRATVYNILNEFVAVGLLRSFYSGAVGKTIYDSNTENHYHLYDAATDEIVDIDARLVKINTQALKDFEIEHVEVLFRGRKR